MGFYQNENIYIKYVSLILQFVDITRARARLWDLAAFFNALYKFRVLKVKQNGKK